MGCPSQAILEENLTFTVNLAAGSGAPVDADASVSYSIYEDETGTAIVTGTMALLDDAGTTGFYSEQIACTTAIGYERFKTYNIRITAAINSITVIKAYSFMCLGGSDVISSTQGALTTVSNFKLYAGISGSDDDTLIADLINRATKLIQNWTKRTLISTAFRERYNGGGSNIINLREYPVTDIDFFSVGLDDAISVINVNSDAYRAAVRVEDSTLATPTMTLEVYGGTNDGSSSITLTDHATLTLLVAAINALGTGWTAATQSSAFDVYDPIELLPIGRRNAFNMFAFLQVPAEPKESYETDLDAGLIVIGHNTPRGQNNITVRYTAGYVTTPADLEQACIDVVKLMYDSRKQTSGLDKEKLGDYSYQKSPSSGQSVDLGNLPVSITRILDNYKAFNRVSF